MQNRILPLFVIYISLPNTMANFNQRPFSRSAAHEKVKHAILNGGTILTYEQFACFAIFTMACGGVSSSYVLREEKTYQTFAA